MSSIFEFTDFVNEQVAFHERKAQEFQGHKRERPHRATAEKFRALLNAMEELRGAVILHQPPGSNPLALVPNDVQGLPPELLEQLVNLPDNDKLESDVLEIINSAGGTLLLDHILISLFKKTGEIHQRPLLVSKLYRMNKKGLVFSSPAKKGAYTTIQPPEDHDSEIDESSSQLELK